MDSKEKSKKLFPEFPPVTTQSWEELIISDLKGADYEKKLVWKTDEGFDVRPYYRSEDLEPVWFSGALPNEYPFARGSRIDRNNWIIRQDIFASDISAANKSAREAIGRGADGVCFNVKEITSHKQMNQLLDGIDITQTQLHFSSSRSYPLTLELFIYEAGFRNLAGDKIKGSLNFDPISYLLLHGDFYISQSNNFDEAEYLLNTALKRMPHLRIINVNGHYFNNSGSTLVQELGFSIASGNEYLAGLTSRGFHVDDIAPRIQVSLSTGSNYFMEIAKLRAARILWAKVVEQYKPLKKESMELFLHAGTSVRNKTIYDPYVNMLRTTTEGMAAAIGNADSISVLPFDFTFKNPDDFSQRIALNQQLIFKEEAHLDKTIDPSAGSYYIENLTNSIAEHAWNLFRLVEEKGGIIECIKSGFIQDEIEQSRLKKEADISQRKTVSIGTNQYPNTGETMLDKVDMEKEELTEAPASPYKKLRPGRDTEAFEKMRLDTEKHIMQGHKRPSVFLFQTGNLAMRKARAGFATNFFGCAGFEIIDNAGFSSIDDGVNCAAETGAEIIAICSSDEEYEVVAPQISREIKKKLPDSILVVAGYPKDIMDKLKAEGLHDFIHLRSNLLQTLVGYQKRMGIAQ